MGYVFLGMAALDYISLTGAVMYMFAHAMATGMLFAMAGWVYDQTHTRDIPSLGGLSNRMPFISGCFVVACMASIGVPGTVNFLAEVMIIVGSWNKYPFQVIVAVVGIVLTLAYLFKMMRGLFYGPMDQKYSHAHDAVSIADRLPILIMITVSIGFFFFPMHLYNVVRSGVDPLIAKITRVVPVASHESEQVGLKREAKAGSSPQNLAALPGDVSLLTPDVSRSDQ
jgi:NADH-quinone oxidoreductase subunit M